MKRLRVLTGLLLLTLSHTGITADDVGANAEVEVIAQTQMMWNGQALPPFTQGTPEITILRYTIAPGVRLPMHVHDYVNAGVVLEGTLTVYSADGETRQLKANDALIELVNVPHYGVNEGDTEAVILVFYAGEAGQPLSRPCPEPSPCKAVVQGCN